MDTATIVAPILILILIAAALSSRRSPRGKRTPIAVDRDFPDYWPKFVDGHKAVARWIREDHRERVYLVSRPDGAFNTYAERFEYEPDYQSWIPVFGSSLYASVPVATREIEAEWPWTRGKDPEKRKPNHTPDGICQPADGLTKPSV